tara:strand:+ start:2159 stop:3034 length:876 start_codon:yes stop_codon:yes gene_type:complete
MRITIIGSGYVGFAMARLLASKNHKIFCVDISEKRVNEINEMNLQNIKATTNIDESIKNSEAAFIAVPTPSNEDGSINLNPIKEATKALANALKDKEKYFLVTVKSTVTPKTCEEIILPILKKQKEDIGLCMNPEFITQIHSSWTMDHSMKRDWSSEDKIVIGANNEIAANKLEEIYQPTNIPIIKTTLRTAELVKYASNVHLATRISFFNEIFLLSKELDIDSEVIATALSMDKRIGRYGTVHGKAYGGACFPKDVSAFLNFSEKYTKTPIARATKEINDKMKEKYGVRE